MADNKIKVIIDVVGDKASTSLRNFRSDLTSTEGAFGKMKVAGSAAFDQIKGAGAEMAVAAGAALVTFGIKAAGAFQDVALEAGRFKDVMGGTSEEASRWLAVVKPLGVEMGDLSDVFNNLAGLVDANDQSLKDLGVTIAKDASGRVNMSETVLRIVEALGQVEDPARRAALMAKFFGEEGARQFAPLVAQAKDLREQFDNVSDAKIIDEGELKRAREMRDRMKELKDKFADFQMEVGEKVVPVLIALADQAIVVADAVGTVSSVIDESINIVERAIGVDEDKAKSGDKITTGTWATVDATGKLIAVTEEMTAAAKAEADATKATAEELEAFDGLVGLVAGAQTQLEETIAAANEAMLEQAGILQEQIDAQRAAADSAFALRDAEADLAEKVGSANDEMKEADGDLYKVRAVLDDVAQSAGEVADSTVRVWEEQAKANGTTLTAAQRQEMWNQKMIGSASTLDGPMRDAVLQYAADVNGIPPEKVSEIRALLDRGEVAYAEAVLNDASRTRDAAILSAVASRSWTRAATSRRASRRSLPNVAPSSSTVCWSTGLPT
jgi:hypothetical protein